MEERREGKMKRELVFGVLFANGGIRLFLSRSTSRSVFGLILGGKFRWMDVLFRRHATLPHIFLLGPVCRVIGL